MPAADIDADGADTAGTIVDELATIVIEEETCGEEVDADGAVEEEDGERLQAINPEVTESATKKTRCIIPTQG